MSETTILVRMYGTGTATDEGGTYHVERQVVPAWVRKAMHLCSGCRNDFYNGRANCTGNSWCLSLTPSMARRKTRPPCHHT